ncbi:MAG: aspartyl/glutamyl-tRNA(Asn/Gln) amidotransferase subunit C [Pirellulaceae bacterium]|nr:MAG: aspartyl/glutamyl-tRNA(Asn/Gln) amidotransferase subunit C [Pirellulaceae bacterium]
MPVEINPALVRHIAELARLELDDQLIQRLASDLAEILAYVERLDELDTESVQPMAHALDLTDVFADDVPGPCLERQEALANAPKKDGEFFLVPAVL